MKNSNILLKRLPIALILGVLLSACSGIKDLEKPNIVVLISDDQGWTDYSFMDHAAVSTPRIDQLASEGLCISHGYSTAPLCRPALASIASGLYVHQHGILGNDPVFELDGIAPYSEEWHLKRREVNEPVMQRMEDIRTLAEILGENGYVSFQSGKWWEGHFTRGGFSGGMTHGDPERGGRHGDVGLEIGRKGLGRVFDFIDRAVDNEDPFYLWYAPFMPHTPHNPPDSILAKYQALAPSGAVARYWAMCEWFDASIGQIVDYVEGKGLSENTLFIYVTDNGWIQDPERTNRYAPRSKREPYEMGIRTPIIYRWKGRVEAEMDESSVSSSVDIASTVLGVCGLELAEGMQGINVLDKSARENRTHVFAETYAHDFSTIDSSLYYRIIISKPWKLILPDPLVMPDKLPELYKLDEDPHEEHDLAGELPEIVKEMEVEIEDWWTSD